MGIYAWDLAALQRQCTECTGKERDNLLKNSFDRPKTWSIELSALKMCLHALYADIHNHTSSTVHSQYDTV